MAAVSAVRVLRIDAHAGAPSLRQRGASPARARAPRRNPNHTPAALGRGGLLLLIAAFACSATAAEERIDRFRIAGGGGTSSSGAWSLSGTIGQGEADVVALCSSDGPDPGLCAGAAFELAGGFWAGRPPLAPHPGCGGEVGCLFRDGFEAAE